jgi:hypothetical protein
MPSPIRVSQKLLVPQLLYVSYTPRPLFGSALLSYEDDSLPP